MAAHCHGGRARIFGSPAGKAPAVPAAFLAAWRGARSHHGKGEVPAWLWGIASRRLASLARRQGGDELPLDAAGEGADPAAGPEQAVQAAQAAEVPEGTLKAACTGPVRESARSCTH